MNLKAKPTFRISGIGTVSLGLLLLATASLAGFYFFGQETGAPIRLGILHALTGPMAISEKPMVEAEQLAIEEINASGGVLGRPVTAFISDTSSDPDTTVRELEKLIDHDKVSAIVGCWTSACRKTAKPIVERSDALMIYPMAYEGLEISPNIIYTGAAPNQQVIPAVNWSYEHLGKRFFLVGSDYIWPHSVNAIVGDQLMALGGELVGEAYIPFGSLDPGEAIQKIRESRPDVILSTVVGDSNLPFYRALRESGISAKQSPVVSFSISETEVQKLPVADIAGHYSAWCYFQAINRPENTRFVQRFRNRYGDSRVVSDVMETAYFSTHLWARALERADSTAPDDVNQAILGLSYDAPEGIITIDPATRHTWRSFSIGQIENDNSIRIVWSADYPLRPVPYPRSRSVKTWDQFVDNLYQSWGQQWANQTRSKSTPDKDRHVQPVHGRDAH